MKREDLKALKIAGLENGLPAEVIDQIMDMNGKSINEAKRQLELANTEKQGLLDQVNKLTEQLKGFDGVDVNGLKTKIEELQKQNETDKEALGKQLAAKEYEYAIREATTGLKFSSNAAKRAFEEDLTAKGLKLENGKLLGLDDYVKEYKEQDTGAFINEDPKPEQGTGVKADLGGSHDSKASEVDFARAIMGLKPRS